MGLWDKLKGELIDIIEWLDDSRDTIVAQINSPRQGVMPNWSPRLDPATIKAVTLYVHSLGGGD